MDKKHLSIVGFGKNRQEKDYYPTPPETTEALFLKEKFEGTVWECASGEGWMSMVIEKYNECISSDIRTDKKVYGHKGINFLKNYETITKKFYLNKVDNIITNPPYRFAKEFVETAKKITRYKIAMLLKLVFLEGINRYKMFQDKIFPLKTVYVFCKRQKIYKNGFGENKNSGLIAYAWFVWDKNYKGKPTIEWIPQ